MKDERKVVRELYDEFGKLQYQVREGDSLRLYTKEQLEYVETHDMNFNAGVSYVKFYSDIVPALLKHLSASELKMVLALIPLAKWEQCIIAKTTPGHTKTLDLKGIAEETGLSYDFVKRRMNALRNKGVVGVHKIGSILPEYDGKIREVYTVNPYVFFNGKNINSTINELYSKTGWLEELARCSD